MVALNCRDGDLHMRILTASATCPACGGDCSLLDEPSTLSASDTASHLLGRSVRCHCSPCNAEFSIRPGEVMITMSIQIASVDRALPA